MHPRVSVQELLAELGDDGERGVAAATDAQRVRVVAAMRRAHVELVHDKRPVFTARKRAVLLLVAAVAALSGTALAARGGLEQVTRWLDRGRVVATPVTPPSEVVASRHLGAGSDAPTSAPAGSQAPNSGTPGVVGSVVGNDSASAAAAPDAARPGGSQASVSPRSSTAGRAAEPHAAAEEDRELAAVNELFSEAKRARREHRDADALAACEKLLAKFPHSVLAQEAAVERFRALARLGRSAEARHFAARYLASYPNGFAAGEARMLTVAASDSVVIDDSSAPPP